MTSTPVPPRRKALGSDSPCIHTYDVTGGLPPDGSVTVFSRVPIGLKTCDYISCALSDCRIQEEGEWEYEYASYKPHAENGKEEVHIEPAILLQPLTTEEAGEAKLDEVAHNGIMLCKKYEAAIGHPCEVGLLGKLEHALGRTWHTLKSAAIGAAHSFGLGDMVCNNYDKCLGPVIFVEDANQCIDGGDCQAVSQDLSEYFPAKP